MAVGLVLGPGNATDMFSLRSDMSSLPYAYFISSSMYSFRTPSIGVPFFTR